MYLQFTSFLHSDMAQVVELLSRVRQELNLFYIVNSMGADVLETQGARASATMVLTMLNQNNLVFAHQGLIKGLNQANLCHEIQGLVVSPVRYPWR